MWTCGNVGMLVETSVTGRGWCIWAAYRIRRYLQQYLFAVTKGRWGEGQGEVSAARRIRANARRRRLLNEVGEWLRTAEPQHYRPRGQTIVQTTARQRALHRPTASLHIGRRRQNCHTKLKRPCSARAVDPDYPHTTSLLLTIDNTTRSM